MKVLGIDTTRKRAKIFILNEDNEYVENINENIKHSEGLFLYLEKALLENKLELKDFDAFFEARRILIKKELFKIFDLTYESSDDTADKARPLVP